MQGIIVGRKTFEPHIFCVFKANHWQLEKEGSQSNNIRIEEDLLGTREVPADATMVFTL